MAATSDDVHTELPKITPEKLTILKLKHSEMGRDVFSEPSSPTSGRSFSFGDALNTSSITRRSTNRSVSSARRRSSFLQSHRSEMSRELTSQAEGKFFALMDFMSNASREASSLKESWSRIVSERESLLRENKELQVRVDEVSETLERRESEFHHHSHDHGEKKKHIEKLLLELSVSAASVKEHQNKTATKDKEIERVRLELRNLRSSMDQSHHEHESLKTEMQSILAKLRSCEEDRDHAQDDANRHHTEHRKLVREHTDLKNKHTEMTAKWEVSRKEALTLTDRIKLWELERDEFHSERDRLHEETRRAKHRADETARELSELTEQHERSQRDANKTKEALRVLELERDEQSLMLENLRRDLKLKATGWEESEEHCADITLRYEAFKREVASVKEKLREVEAREIEARDAGDRAREHGRTVVIERDQLRDDLHDSATKIAEGHRRVALLEDSVRRAEAQVAELRSELHTLGERSKALIIERDESHTTHGHLHVEVSELKEKIMVLQAEIRIVSEARDRHRAELDQWRQKYEEVTETITEFRDDSGEMEFEIESLRTLLREARDQKERAISARYAADKERDEIMSRYEEKCREMERFEESASAAYHASASGKAEGGRSTFTRTMSSGTTVHHDKHGHHNSVGGVGYGMFSP